MAESFRAFAELVVGQNGRVVHKVRQSEVGAENETGPESLHSPDLCVGCGGEI